MQIPYETRSYRLEAVLDSSNVPPVFRTESGRIVGHNRTMPGLRLQYRLGLLDLIEDGTEGLPLSERLPFPHL